MVKTILLFVTLLFAAPQVSTVYICDSSKAIAYHSNKNCSGLQHCTHKILSVSEKDAINVYGRRKCHICY